MYREISINGFRGFAEFHMRDLGRVNLLVGTNNCGKSTILEAVELLCSAGDPAAIWSITKRRGEHFWHERDDREWQTEAAITHLFHGHSLALDNAFTISGETDSETQTYLAKVVKRSNRDPMTPHELEFGKEGLGPFSVLTEWRSPDKSSSSEFNVTRNRLPLSIDGRLPPYAIVPVTKNGDAGPVRYITTTAMSVDEVGRLFDEIVLTDEEALLIDALRNIEPSIERIAKIGGGRWQPSSSRSSIVLKCANVPERLPIGTMGDGIWRMLGIAIALVTAKDGFLLVDEIDTGLHYSVMEDMWRLVERTAERLNVQVFATTHSRDCYESLAAIARESVTEESQVTIQRIEKGQAEAVSYSEREIVIATERGLEVR